MGGHERITIESFFLSFLINYLESKEGIVFGEMNKTPSRQWWGFSSCKGWDMNKKKKKIVCAYQEIARIDSSIPLMQVDKITFYFVKCFLWVNPIFFMRLFFISITCKGWKDQWSTKMDKRYGHDKTWI